MVDIVFKLFWFVFQEANTFSSLINWLKQQICCSTATSRKVGLVWSASPPIRSLHFQAVLPLEAEWARPKASLCHWLSRPETQALAINTQIILGERKPFLLFKLAYFNYKNIKCMNWHKFEVVVMIKFLKESRWWIFLSQALHCNHAKFISIPTRRGWCPRTG